MEQGGNQPLLGGGLLVTANNWRHKYVKERI